MTVPTPGVPTAREWIDENETFHSRRGHCIAYRRRGRGPTVLLLHGFPTWSYDYAAVATDLARDHDVITLDFLGYGVSDKPRGYHFSVAESADIVEDLLAHLGVHEVRLVIHDYGGIVGQELLDRRSAHTLAVTVASVVVLNCGIVYSEYRPTRLQKMLTLPVLGKLVSGRITAARTRAGLDAVRGTPLTDAEFDDMWLGMSYLDGHKLAHRHITYNAERAQHHRRWEAALAAWDGPLTLVWGLDDPVSGRHVLEKARVLLPRAEVVELPGIGHFPQHEAPRDVAEAIRAR
ncbi:alpha/beta hydrolase [Mycolicibacterium sp. 018/SC-01/001]|uniref:alpha/beta fold hydrolase n=1 Tax=Mycolicibacterium sp. 018/SC-01/001 TaxID=2592069 RepID=UPI00117C877A|nr:alpha/beta hydrolase [Mycolicibacterium sp. 018/SC-01/001]TRW79866.1 alpha/beta hydrolase [Mycolicibacterium sp. 018/SC-01/001]